MESKTSCIFFFFNAPATPEIYTLSLHDALPIYAAGRCTRRRAALGGRAPRRAACRRRPARFISRSRSRVARRGRDRSRLSAARQSDDREGGLRASAEVLRRRVLLVEVAAQPAHVHAPRAQLYARASFPHAVRVPDCAD